MATKFEDLVFRLANTLEGSITHNQLKQFTKPIGSYKEYKPISVGKHLLEGYSSIYPNNGFGINLRIIKEEGSSIEVQRILCSSESNEQKILENTLELLVQLTEGKKIPGILMETVNKNGTSAYFNTNVY